MSTSILAGELSKALTPVILVATRSLVREHNDAGLVFIRTTDGRVVAEASGGLFTTQVDLRLDPATFEGGPVAVSAGQLGEAMASLDVGLPVDVDVVSSASGSTSALRMVQGA